MYCTLAGAIGPSHRPVTSIRRSSTGPRSAVPSRARSCSTEASWVSWPVAAPRSAASHRIDRARARSPRLTCNQAIALWISGSIMCTGAGGTSAMTTAARSAASGSAMVA